MKKLVLLFYIMVFSIFSKGHAQERIAVLSDGTASFQTVNNTFLLQFKEGLRVQEKVKMIGGNYAYYQQM